jgi:hypothetical protein
MFQGKKRVKSVSNMCRTCAGLLHHDMPFNSRSMIGCVEDVTKSCKLLYLYSKKRNYYKFMKSSTPSTHYLNKIAKIHSITAFRCVSKMPDFLHKRPISTENLPLL